MSPLAESPRGVYEVARGFAQGDHACDDARITAFLAQESGVTLDRFEIFVEQSRPSVAQDRRAHGALQRACSGAVTELQALAEICHFKRHAKERMANRAFAFPQRRFGTCGKTSPFQR